MTGAMSDHATQKTAERFSLLWSRTRDDTSRIGEHLDRTLRLLSVDNPTGLILDAGCGDGSDSVALAERDGAVVIAVDLSDGGTRTAAERTRHLNNVHVVRADLRYLPFRSDQFDFVYSFGVVHHIPTPDPAMAELARVMHPQSKAALYLYEDFAGRALRRWSLRLVNLGRHLTTRLPPRLLFALCAVASPVVFVMCTVPSRILRFIPWTRPLADAVPYHFGAHGVVPSAVETQRRLS